MSIHEQFEKRKLFHGRLLSSSKTSTAEQICVWNANVVIKSQGKIWFGDLNITRDGEKLKEIASEIGEPLYVLREHDCRFETEDDPIDVLISKAVWNTEKE